MNQALRDRIIRTAPCSVREEVPLAPLTTFRIGGPAAVLAEPRAEDELIKLVRLCRADGIPHFYLGHGSNILISDNGFDGVVIRAVGNLCDMNIQGDVLRAGSGARLLLLTTFAAHHDLSGMESLSGIPGSVGGGLYMNAGAYGGEISDTLIEVDILTESGDRVSLQTGDIKFGYRSAPELRDSIILASRYRLKSGKRDRIFSEMRRVWKLRREKQPLNFPSAGSVFKRPPGDYAGRLIEAVNGKGTRVGGAMVSEKHAGIFINYEHATAADVAALIREIRRRVHQEFGILLETEVKPVGFTKDPFATES